MLPITIQLEQGFDSKFKKQVLREISLKLSKALPIAAKTIEAALQKLVKDRLLSSPVVDSLAGGVLRAQFGLIDGGARISSIISRWAESIEVVAIRGTGQGSFGGLKVTFTDENYDIALSMPEAEFITEKGTALPWLRWLLLDGGRAIVGNHFFRSSGWGRTGMGIIIKRESSAWSVPKAYAGTFNNNFATRALEGMQDEIDILIRREITKVIK